MDTKTQKQRKKKNYVMVIGHWSCGYGGGCKNK